MRVSHHMLDGRKITDLEMPFIEKFVLKKMIKRFKGTTIYEMLENYKLI